MMIWLSVLKKRCTHNKAFKLIMTHFLSYSLNQDHYKVNHQRYRACQYVRLGAVIASLLKTALIMFFSPDFLCRIARLFSFINQKYRMRYKVNAHDDALIGCKIHPFDRPAKILSPDSIFCTTALCLMRLWHGLFMPDTFRDNRAYPATWSTFTPDGQHWWSRADGLRLTPQHQINNTMPFIWRAWLKLLAD